MVFSSIAFILFFLPIVLAIYYNPFFKGRRFRNVFLLCASLFFYAWGEPYFVFVMVGSIFINWAIGLAMDHAQGKQRKRWLILGLIFDFSLLFVFKYLGFACDNLNGLFHTSFEVSIALPIGISFYTFQIVSYLIDLYYCRVDVQRNLLDLGLYISMFPQLIAGPIVRYETIEHEIRERKENWSDFSNGLIRFVIGVSKKIILANNIALLADRMFSAGELSVASAWLGAAAYTLQIYFDFSGYSDMAIGLGRMFGFHFNENFNYPYIASSVTEFWRRWHISLSSWFRDYVYIPLGGSRVSHKRHILNLLVVWSLTGLWHGANWTFILWGVVYFAVQIIEKYWIRNQCPRAIGHIYTLLVVILLWVLFRADNIQNAAVYIGKMFGVGANGLLDSAAESAWSNYRAFLILGCIFSLPLKDYTRKIAEKMRLTENNLACDGAAVVSCLGVVSLLIICIAYMLSTSYNPFIYFNF